MPPSLPHEAQPTVAISVLYMGISDLRMQLTQQLIAGCSLSPWRRMLPSLLDELLNLLHG